MDDLISRKAAIAELDSAAWGKEYDKVLAKTMLESLPSAQSEEDCDTCKHGYFGDAQCERCRVRYPSHYERRIE